jgi:hypothetical protein
MLESQLKMHGFLAGILSHTNTSFGSEGGLKGVPVSSSSQMLSDEQLARQLQRQLDMEDSEQPPCFGDGLQSHGRSAHYSSFTVTNMSEQISSE